MTVFTSRPIQRIMQRMVVSPRATLPRRLPYVLVPASGESFPSWLERLAEAFQAPPGVAAKAIGLPTRHAYDRSMLPSMFGITMTPETEMRVEAATGLPATVQRRMHLRRYAHTALDLHDLDPARARSLLPIGRREWALLHTSRACPGCLRDDDGVWQLWWKLGLGAVCPRHNCLLLDTCPQCHEPLHLGRARHTPLLSMSRVAHPRTCHGRHDTCGFDLATATTVSPAAAITETQRVLLVAADSGVCSLGGKAVSAREYFATVRALSAVVRVSATTRNMPDDLPSAAVEAWRSDLCRTPPSAGGSAIGYRSRPATAAGTYALLSVLSPVIRAETLDELGSAYEPLQRRWRRARAANGSYPLARGNPLRGLSLPAPFRGRPAGFAGRVAGAATGTRLRRGPGRPAWVPELVPHHLYGEVAALIPGTADLTGRRYAALCVARVAGAGTWQEAGSWSGCDPSVTASTTSVISQRVRDVDAFWRAIDAIAEELRAHNVAWQARRQQLAYFEAVDPKELSEGRHLGEPWTNSRCRCAAAWVWDVYGGGDWRFSPAMGAQSWRATTASRREIYRRYRHRASPALDAAVLNVLDRKAAPQ